MVLLQGREGPRIHLEGLTHLCLSDKLLGAFGDEIENFLELPGSDPGFVNISAVCSLVILSAHSVSSFLRIKKAHKESLMSSK